MPSKATQFFLYQRMRRDEGETDYKKIEAEFQAGNRVGRKIKEKAVPFQKKLLQDRATAPQEKPKRYKMSQLEREFNFVLEYLRQKGGK